jgi:hypothetical protein
MSNLPPGVSASMIPGNTAEDEAWDYLWEVITLDTADLAISPDDALKIWRFGLSSWKNIKDLMAI